MGQTNELDRVKARIKALAEKSVSNGCTEAEAIAAAEMVGRLLEELRQSFAAAGIEVDLAAKPIFADARSTRRGRRPDQSKGNKLVATSPRRTAETGK